MALYIGQCPWTDVTFPAYEANDHCNYHLPWDSILQEELELEAERYPVEKEKEAETLPTENAFNKLRAAVSQKKKRFQRDGFDLDLTYITPRIIAMGFPSHGREGYYRNPVDQVEKFFEHYHKGGYKVFNLCSEREYHDPNVFGRSWQRFPFDDHNPPVPITLIPQFCTVVDEFLRQRPSKNVVAVHCKAGKGRTGVMIVCYLMYSRPELRKAADGLLFFGKARTSDGKGVTIPSQQRYCWYWEQVLNQYEGVIPPPRTVSLRRIVVSSPIRAAGSCEPYFIVEQAGEAGARLQIVDTRKIPSTKFVPYRDGKYDFDLARFDVKAQGDLKFWCYDKGRLKDDHLFHFWVNTAFTPQRVQLPKLQLDKACKDKEGRYDPNLLVDICLEDVAGA